MPTPTQPLNNNLAPDPVGNPVPSEPLPPPVEPTKPVSKPRKPRAKKPAEPQPMPSTSQTAETTAPTLPLSKNKAENGKPERPIVYTEVKLALRLIAAGKGWNAELAKKYLGWQEESPTGPFKERFAFKDRRGVKIRCAHNDINRPLRWGQVETLVQEILRRRWRFNGEPIIIGNTGRILGGQHTLIAVVLATQDWEDNPEKWKPYWPTAPEIDKVAVLGISEDDETVNTLDTGIPRSLGDVIARSRYFAGKPEKVRVKLATVLEHAVRQMWHRTGASDNAFAPLRTHSESLAFLEYHPRLEEAVAHIWEQDGDNKSIKRFVPVGYASALCYLMGVSMTQGTKPDGSGYLDTSNRSEALLDFSLWERALTFWENIAERATEFNPLFKAYEYHFNAGDGQASLAVRLSLAIKAWNAFADERKLTEKLLTLTFAVDEDGVKKLAEAPTIGGIDLAKD